MASIADQAQIDAAFANMPSASSAREGLREATEDYRVTLPVFEGPLDLLLHLIRREQINIYDIPVSRICQSYLEQLELMSNPDVDLAGEFFVMAATLVHLKSLVLLPKDEIAPEEDPRLPLVAQLLEYERFKKAATELDARSWLDRDVYARPLSAADDIPVETLAEAPLDPIETFQLLICLKAALDRTHRPPMQISLDTTSLREKVSLVGQYLEERGLVEFRSLLPPDYRRIDIVMSFMAILELARLKYVEIVQNENFGPIHVRKVQSVESLDMALLQQF